MVNFNQFHFDKYFWLGQHEVRWLAPNVTFIIHAEQSGIPDSQRKVIQFVCDLPLSTRTKLEGYVYHKYTTEIYGSIDPVEATPRIKRAPEVWKLLSQPGVNIPPFDRIRPDCYFAVSFECVWDEEHGVHMLFNNAGEPIAIGGSGDFF